MSERLEIVEFTVGDRDVVAFLARRPAAVAALGEAFDGLLDARLARFDDGTWVDVVRWRSLEEAKAAAAGMSDVAEAASWAGLIAVVTSMRHAALQDATA